MYPIRVIGNSQVTTVCLCSKAITIMKEYLLLEANLTTENKNMAAWLAEEYMQKDETAGGLGFTEKYFNWGLYQS